MHPNTDTAAPAVDGGTEYVTPDDVDIANHSGVEFESLVSALVGRNPDPVIIIKCVSPDLMSCPVVYVNSHFRLLTGYSLADFESGGCPVISQLYALPNDEKRARHAIANVKPDQIESQFHARDGRRLYVNVSLMPAAGPDGDAACAVITLHDITALKEIAEKGAAAGADMRSVLASARCLVWHAIVENRGASFCWNIHAEEDEAVRRWLPVSVLPGERFFDAIARSVHPEDAQRIDGYCQQCMVAGQSRYSQEYRVCLDTGEYRWLSEDVQVERLAPHRWRLVGVCTDISEQKAAKENLAEERNLLRTLIDNIPDGIYFKDTSSRFIIDNSIHTRLLGADKPESIVGKTDFDFFPHDVASDYYSDELRIIKTGIPLINKEEPIIMPNGQRLWLSSTKVPLRDSAGTVVGLVGISRDITPQKRLEAEREQLLADAIDRADRDPLTGLWNHRAFQKRLKDEADLALARGGSIAVIVLDMDNFKFFNDSYGHTVGDEVLCEAARALRSACRPEDTVARYGGDEFAIVMPLSDSRSAADNAARIAGSLRGLGYRPPGHASVVPMKLSFGLAVYPDEATARLDALALADTRLMRAKTGVGDAGELAERLSAELLARDRNFNMLSALVTSVDNKDRYTRRHSEDVLLYGTWIAESLGMDADAKYNLQVAALVHDVGKIGIPDSILRKPAKLTTAEFDAIKLHPTMGAVIVSAIPGYTDIVPGVKHHHERWDGDGYPDGLAGNDIPLIARILSVADGYSAMTSDRPYRKGMNPKTAMDILADGSGKQWDPDIVATFVAVQKARTK